MGRRPAATALRLWLCTLLLACLLPARADVRFADFSQSTITTSNMTVTPGGAFEWSEWYQIWRIVSDGGGFSASFTADAAGDLVLQVRHQTSASANCPGEGYSPVNILLNGTPVVERFDPAEHHEGTHGIATDAWRISVQAGDNTIAWTLIESCTHYWMRRIELVPYVHVESDIAIGALNLSPLDCDPGSQPQEVDFVLTNLGPVRLAPPHARVELELFLSRDTTLNLEDDLFAGRFGWDADLASNEGRHIVLGPEALARLAIPCPAWGDYCVLGRVLPGSPSTLVDPNPANNVACLPLTLHVTPRGAGLYADFSCREIATGGMTVQPSPCFVFNSQSGGNRALVCRNATAFYALFDLPGAGDYWLSAYHLTSAYAECPGGGYSPISIYLNDTPVVEDYDPSEQHAGFHGYVTDSWRISAPPGENVIEWVGGELCTSYWLQRFEVTPVDMPLYHTSITRLRSGGVELVLRGPAGASLSLLASPDLAHWSTLTNVLNVTGTVVFRDDQASVLPQRFYRTIPD